LYKTQITQQILPDIEELAACNSFSSLALKHRAAHPEQRDYVASISHTETTACY
jgi:hypothetical protein